MARERSLFSNYFRCAGVIAVALMGMILGLTGGALISIGSGLAVVANDAETGPSQPQKTYLNIRMESLRRIQEALAKPLPSPEPLPRITAHLATSMSGNAPGIKIVTAQQTRYPAKSNHHQLMAKARDVFEKIEPTAPDAQLSAYAEIDRHAVH